MSNIQKLLWWFGSGITYPVENGLPILTLNSTATIAAYDGNDADNDGWYGRASVVERSDGVIVLSYREARAHNLERYGVMHLRFSDDYGVTWSNEDQYLDGTPIVGFPMRPTGSGDPSGNNRGPVEGTMIICPNSDILIHMWSSDYASDNDGAWQARSSDGGLTWTDLRRITWLGTIVDNDEVFFTQGNVVVGTTIYTTVRKITSKSPYAEELYIATSTDNGANWTVISKVTTAGNDNSSGEASLEYVGSNRFMMTMRSAKNLNAYYTYSTDGCLTWATPIDVTINMGISAWLGRTIMRTRAHSKKLPQWWNDRLLIITGFTGGTNNVSLGARRNAAWVCIIPENYNLANVRFYGPYHLDSVGYDGGYGDYFYNPNTDEYVQISYRGPTSMYDSSLKQYNFDLSFLNVLGTLFYDRFTDNTIDTNKWSVTDPADGVTISETNQRITFTINTASPVASSNTNFIQTVDTFAANSKKVFRFFISAQSNISALTTAFKINNASESFALGRQIQIIKLNSGANATLRIYNGSSFVYDFTTAISFGNTFKVVIEANNDIKFYYFNTSTLAWVQIGTTQNYDLGGDVKAGFCSNSAGTGSPLVEYDTFYVTDYDYDNTVPYDGLPIGST